MERKTYWGCNKEGKRFDYYYENDIIFPEFQRITGKTKKEFFDILNKEYGYDHFIPEYDPEFMDLHQFIEDYKLDMNNIRENSLKYGFDYDEQIGKNGGMYVLHMLNQDD